MVPNTGTLVIIGNTANKPVINGSLAANMHSLIIQNGGHLTLQNLNLRINVLNGLQIQAGGRLTNSGSDLLVNGNWSNSGAYEERVYSGLAPRVELGGSNQTIGGASANNFNHLKISGTISLLNPISIAGQTGVTSRLEVLGEFDPGTHRVSFTNVSSDMLHVGPAAVLKVKADSYAGNYALGNGTAVYPALMYVNSVIDYAALGNQSILPANYGRLTISGGGIKSLTGTTSISPISELTQLNVLAGTLNMGSHTLNRARSGDQAVAGGTLNLANGATLQIGGANDFPSGFANVNLGINSQVEYTGANQTIAAQQYGNLTMRGTGTKTMQANTLVNAKLITNESTTVEAAQNLYVRGNVELLGASTLNGGNHTLTLEGDWKANATFNGGTSTVRFAGANRSIERTGTGAATFHNLTVSAPSLIAKANTVSMSGNLLVGANGSLQHMSGGNWLMTGANASIAGNDILLNQLQIAGTVGSTARVRLAGNLTVNSGGSLVASAGAFILEGLSKEINNEGTLEFYNLLVNGTANTIHSFEVVSTLNGQGKITATNGTVTFKGASTYIGQHDLYNVTVAGVSLSMGTHASLGIAGALQVQPQATFDTKTNSPSTVLFNGINPQDIPALAYHHLNLSNPGTKTAAGNILTNGNLKIENGSTLQAGNYTHTVAGNWINEGVFEASNSTVEMTGGSSTISGINEFATLRINTNDMQDQITLVNTIQASTVDMTKGTLQTGNNEMIVTTDRVGNGWVMGTIRRMHAFADNVAYAFNAPYTTIRFGTVAGVNEVAMKVSISSVEDFTIGEAINMRYTVDIPDNGTYSNASLQLNYYESQLNGNIEDELQLFRKQNETWAFAGTNTRDTTDNWLNQTGLSDVSGDWTASSSSFVYQWTGAVSQDWHQADNWQISGDEESLFALAAVPSANDIVELGELNVLHQPVITSNVELKILRFKGNHSTVLTLQSGNLAVMGNFGASSEGAQVVHTVQVGNNDLTVGGNMLLGHQAGNNSIGLVIGAGSVTVRENLQHFAQGSISLGSGTFNLKGNYELTAPFTTFTSGTGAFVYNGEGNQIIGPVQYYDLVVNKTSGEAILETSNTGHVQRHVIVQAGVLKIPSGDYIVSGDVIQHAGKLDMDRASVRVQGDILHYGGEIVSNSSSITAEGNRIYTYNAITFNNLTLNPTASISLEGKFRVNEELMLQRGIIDIGESQINNTLIGRKLLLASKATLALSASNFPDNFISLDIQPESTVLYNGEGEQHIAPLTYGHLRLENGGSFHKKLTGSTHILNDLNIAASANLEYTDLPLHLHGNLFAMGGFTAKDSASLVLHGSDGIPKSIGGAQTPLAIGDLTVLNGAVYELGRNMLIAGNATISGNENIQDTEWANNGHLDAKTHHIELSGNLLNYGILKGSGIYTLTGARKQEVGLFTPIQPSSVLPPRIRFNGSVRPVFNTAIDPLYGDIDINNTAGIYPTVNWHVTGILQVGEGALFHGGDSHHTIQTGILNNGIIESAGILEFKPTEMGKGLSQYTMDFGPEATSFKSTGTVRISGNQKAALTGAIPADLFNLQLQNLHGDGLDLGGLTGQTLRVRGDLTVGIGTELHTADKTLVMEGNLANNGQLNGSGSDVTFTSQKLGATGEPLLAVFSGIGHSTFRHFEVAPEARMTVSTEIIHLHGDFRHFGDFFDGSQTELKFVGSQPAVMIATEGKSIPIQHLHVSKADNSTLTLYAPIEQVTSLMVESGKLDAQEMPITAASSAENNLISLQNFSIDDGAAFKLAGTTTLPAFNKYDFAPASKVSYYGSNQDVQATQYGHLELLNEGMKTFLGDSAKVAGNFTVSAQTLVTAPAVFAYNGYGDQQIAPIQYQALALMGSGSKQLSAGITEVTHNLNRYDEANLFASVTNSTLRYSGSQLQEVLPTNYYNLELTGSGGKEMSGTTGIAAAFTVDTPQIVELLPESTVLFNGMEHQNVPALDYQNLRIQGDGQKSLLGDISVAAELHVVAGILKTDSYKIELLGDNSRLVESETAYVTGVIETNRLLDAGMPQDFGNLGLTVTPASGAAGYTKVQRTTGIAVGDNQNSILRQYRIYPEGTNSGLDATVEFAYFDHELNGNPEPDLIFYTSTSDTNWKAVTSGTQGDNLMTLSGQTNLSNYTLGTAYSPLPVSLIYFKAERQGSDAKLNWATASESDNKGFVVEVSTDGKVFRELTFVSAKGVNSSLRHDYNYIDRENGKQGIRYYRLRQQDLDGEQEIFGAKSLYFGVLQNESVSSYPNPFDYDITLSLALEAGGPATLKLVDMTGRTLYTYTAEVQAGLTTLPLELQQLQLQTGVYLLTFELNGEVKQLKLLKR